LTLPFSKHFSVCFGEYIDVLFLFFSRKPCRGRVFEGFLQVDLFPCPWPQHALPLSCFFYVGPPSIDIFPPLGCLTKVLQCARESLPVFLIWPGTRFLWAFLFSSPCSPFWCIGLWSRISFIPSECFLFSSAKRTFFCLLRQYQDLPFPPSNPP